MPSGERREDKGRKVGVFTASVIAVNPIAEEIAKLYGSDQVGDEPAYVTEKDTDVPDHVGEDGVVVKVTKTVRSARLDFYLRDNKTEMLTKRSYFIRDIPFVKKDLSKQQYLNALGKTAWVDDPANLPKKFVHYLDKEGNVVGDIPYRPAYSGEADLVNFLDQWLVIDKKKDYDLSVNVDAFFKGNFKELQSLVSSDLDGAIMGVYTVRMVDGEQGVQFYQDVYKNVLPEYCYKFFTLKDYNNPEELDKIVEKNRALSEKIKNKEKLENKDWLPNYEKLILEMIDEEYGCKDSFSLAPATDFDPAQAIRAQASNVEADGDSY